MIERNESLSDNQCQGFRIDTKDLQIRDTKEFNDKVKAEKEKWIKNKPLSTEEKILSK